MGLEMLQGIVIGAVAVVAAMYQHGKRRHVKRQQDMPPIRVEAHGDRVETLAYPYLTIYQREFSDSSRNTIDR